MEAVAGSSRKMAKVAVASFRLEDLPEDVLARVLLFLPMRDILRAGNVCRRWLAISASPAFRSSWSQIVRLEDFYLPFLVAASLPNVCLAFNPSSQRWLPMPDLGFLAGSVTVRCTSTGVFESAHKGLFCKWNYLTKGSLPKLVVFNPVTKCCRTLPGLETECVGPEYCATHLRVDDDTRGYNVIVVESGGNTVRVCNYESKSDSWTVWSSRNSGDLSLLYYANSVYRDGVIYCVGLNKKSLDNGDSPYHCLFMYKVGEREWKPLCEIPDDEKIPMLIECASGIMVVTSNVRVFLKGLTVYSVDSTTGRLSEIGQAPDEFDHFRRLFNREYQTSYLHPVGLGNLICFPTIESKQALIYDTDTDTWQYWPSGPFTWPDRPRDRRLAPHIPPLRFPVSLRRVRNLKALHEDGYVLVPHRRITLIRKPVWGLVLINVQKQQTQPAFDSSASGVSVKRMSQDCSSRANERDFDHAVDSITLREPPVRNGGRCVRCER